MRAISNIDHAMMEAGECHLPMPDSPDPKPRTIDERLDRLMERHEALTQTVELTAVVQRDNDERWNKRFAEIAEAIRGLARIAEIHEHRISRLEDEEQ